MNFILVRNIHYNTVIWYQKITDLDKLQEHQGHFARWLWNTTWSDPHFEAALEKGDEHAAIRHPVNLATKRAIVMCRNFLKYGVIYINQKGGWCLPSDDDIILQEVEQENWPTDANVQSFSIYIAKWPLGNHYYLTAWPHPIMFSAEKFNTYEEAMVEALKHAPEKKIHWKEHMHDKFIYNREGD